MNLKPIMFGDSMEIVSNITISDKNDYVLISGETNITTGVVHKYYMIDGHASIIGYLLKSGIWYFPN